LTAGKRARKGFPRMPTAPEGGREKNEKRKARKKGHAGGQKSGAPQRPNSQKRTHQNRTCTIMDQKGEPLKSPTRKKSKGSRMGAFETRRGTGGCSKYKGLTGFQKPACAWKKRVTEKRGFLEVRKMEKGMRLRKTTKKKNIRTLPRPKGVKKIWPTKKRRKHG